MASSCRQNLHLQMWCAFKLHNLYFQMYLYLQVAESPPSNVFAPSSCRTSTFKCGVPSRCRTSTFKCVVPSSCRTSTFKCVCVFKLQNLHFQMCLRLQVAEPPPSNVFVPSSCITSTFKCVCALHKHGITIGMPHRYCTGSIL